MSENNTIIFSEDLEDFLLRRNESEGYAMMLFCAAGKMQIDLNHEHFELKEGDLLFCHPHFIIGHYMRTPDFHCRLIVKRGFGMTVTEYRQTLRNNTTTKDNTKNIV